MVDKTIHIIMPVKDSLETAEEAIRAVAESGHTLTIYDDYSQKENAERLQALAEKWHLDYIALSTLTDHPSPNYRTVLIDARQKAIDARAHLCIVESDVNVKKDTIDRLAQGIEPGVGMVAAITVDEQERINYPYTENKKHFSFCCTLLSLELLEKMDLERVLDPEKNWFDVTISHYCDELGLRRILQTDNTVLHRPHSSRPWKKLKYSNPIKYYWRKITQNKDKI